MTATLDEYVEYVNTHGCFNVFIVYDGTEQDGCERAKIYSTSGIGISSRVERCLVFLVDHMMGTFFLGELHDELVHCIPDGVSYPIGD